VQRRIMHTRWSPRKQAIVTSDETADLPREPRASVDGLAEPAGRAACRRRAGTRKIMPLDGDFVGRATHSSDHARFAR